MVKKYYFFANLDIYDGNKVQVPKFRTCSDSKKVTVSEDTEDVKF